MPTEIKVWSFHSTVSKAAKDDLLRHFGAHTVQHKGQHGRNDAVLASFKNEADCKYALSKLHQQEVLGKRLKAVYWDSALPSSQQPHRYKANTKPDDVTQEEKILKKMKEFEVNLCSIAPALGISHPVTPRLRYLYPPPSPDIIANIAQTLIEVPKFYTQVLHLMNKMNLPPPFQPVQDHSSLRHTLSEALGLKEREVQSKTINMKDGSENPTENNNISDHKTSESESELESEGEAEKSIKTPSVPIKRRIKPSSTIRKRPKLSLLKQSCVSHPRAPEFSVRDVFEATAAKGSHKLELRLKDTILPSKGDSVSMESPRQSSNFGKIESVSREARNQPSNSMVEWEREADKYIKREDILNNRVPKSEWPILLVFKNYNPGEPSAKLYIKNLAKTTTEQDLKFIFGHYVFWQNEEEAKLFSISLMKEGRMKGQAFITFPKVEQATQALEDANGYILNDKPMVIAFGKVKKTQQEDSDAKERS